MSSTVSPRANVLMKCPMHGVSEGGESVPSSHYSYHHDGHTGLLETSDEYLNGIAVYSLLNTA